MPKWSNSPPATFVVTPPGAFQDAGFDPVLPFPAPYLNWKLNDLDANGPFDWRGYVTANAPNPITGSGTTDLRLRGGDGGAGDLFQLDLDTNTFAISKWTGGTVVTPSGSQTYLATYSTADSQWVLAQTEIAGSLLVRKDNTTGHQYRYSTSFQPTLSYPISGAAGRWSLRVGSGGGGNNFWVSTTVDGVLVVYHTGGSTVDLRIATDLSWFPDSDQQISTNERFRLVSLTYDVPAAAVGTHIKVFVYKRTRGSTTVAEIAGAVHTAAATSQTLTIGEDMNIALYEYTIEIEYGQVAHNTVSVGQVRDMFVNIKKYAVE